MHRVGELSGMVYVEEGYIMVMIMKIICIIT